MKLLEGACTDAKGLEAVEGCEAPKENALLPNPPPPLFAEAPFTSAPAWLPKAPVPKPPNDLVGDMTPDAAEPFVGGKLRAGLGCPPKAKGFVDCACGDASGAGADESKLKFGRLLKPIEGLEGGPGDGEPRLFEMLRILLENLLAQTITRDDKTC